MAGLDPAIHASPRLQAAPMTMAGSDDIGIACGSVTPWMAGSSLTMTASTTIATAKSAAR